MARKGAPGAGPHAIWLLRYKSNEGERRRGRTHGKYHHHAVLHAQRGQGHLLRGQEQTVLQNPRHLEQSKQPSTVRREQRALPSDRREKNEDTVAGGLGNYDAIGHFLDHHYFHR